RLGWLISYGLSFGTGEFAVLFLAMGAGVPTGLASLGLQASAPLTGGLGGFFLRRRLSPRQLSRVGLRGGGMAGGARARHGPPGLFPLLLTVLAALSWAIGNICSRHALGSSGAKANPIHLALWMSVVPPIPMFVLSSIFEGPSAQWHSLATLGTAEGWRGLAG